MSLTDKQQRFVEEYLVDCNATQAAIRAGYSKRTAAQIGHELLEKTLVAQAIKDAQQKRTDRIEVTQDYVLSTIVDTVERCKQSSPVLDRKGEQVMTETADGNLAAAYAFNPNAVLKGSELLGKHLGMFVERHEHTGKDGGPIETADMSERDMAKAIAFTLARGAQPTAH